jgi:aminocarboxymuconate-semialdehyde decarboxylase
MNTPRRVDLHAHHVGRDLIDEVQARPERYGVRLEIDPSSERLRFPDGSLVRPFFRELWDLDQRLAAMDAQGVAVQAISTWTDIFGDGLLGTDAARAWARLQNDTLAAAARQRPDRLVALGVLPLPDAQAAVEELDYCATVLGMRGVEIGSSIGGRSLDEPAFEPVWTALEQRRFLVLLHPPRATALGRRGERYFLNNLVGNPLESVLGAAGLVFGGVLDRHPDLQIVLPHAGGYFPYQVGRLDRGFAAKDECRVHAPRPPSAYLRRFWYDTLAFRPDVLAFLAGLVGVDRLVFGTDYPFPMQDPDAVAMVEAALPLGDLGGVWATTARALLGL